MTGEHTQDAAQMIEGEGGYDYLARSIAIVTLLYERGILQELMDGGRITDEEVVQRLEVIKEKYDLRKGPGED